MWCLAVKFIQDQIFIHYFHWLGSCLWLFTFFQHGFFIPLVIEHISSCQIIKYIRNYPDKNPAFWVWLSVLESENYLWILLFTNSGGVSEFHSSWCCPSMGSHAWIRRRLFYLIEVFHALKPPVATFYGQYEHLYSLGWFIPKVFDVVISLESNIII